MVNSYVICPLRFSFSYFWKKNLKRETLNQSRVFNECKINDQESDDDVASINSKDDGNAIAANQPTFELSGGTAWPGGYAGGSCSCSCRVRKQLH